MSPWCAFVVTIRGMSQDLNRREFLKVSGAAVVAGAAAAGETVRGDQTTPTPAAASRFAVAPINNVRIGYVGIGGQGSGHVQNLLKIAGCRISAVCDIRPERTEWAEKQCLAAG